MSAGLRPGLGFGCAELFRLPTARARRRVLAAALDAGIAHFDVAPMYGLGLAEAELGAFARGRRDRMVIATKLGIDVTPAGRLLGRVQRPIRRVMEARPGLRSAARTSAAGPASGGAGGVLYAVSGYDGAAARASLERSLRALGVAHVDLLLLHDPPPGAVAGDVAAALEQARADGLVGTWGVAGELGPTAAVAAALTPAPPVLQVRDDVFDPGLDGLPPATRVTFGSLGAAVGRIERWAAAHPGARSDWRDAHGHDPGDAEAVAALLLRHARLRNPDGVTLFSTTRPERARQAAAAARDAGRDDAARALAELAASEAAR